MKANAILEWVVKESINAEFLGFIDIPEEGECEWEQNEEWWNNTIGGVPPSPVNEGRYLYLYESNVDDTLGVPDAEIELPDDVIHLYHVDA